MIDTKELRTALVRHGTSVLNEDEVLELLDRLEAAEAYCIEHARLNSMRESREAALRAKLEAAEKERDALQAEIGAMEQQRPVCTFVVNPNDKYHLKLVWGEYFYPKEGDRLFLAPGALPVLGIPEG